MLDILNPMFKDFNMKKLSFLPLLASASLFADDAAAPAAPFNFNVLIMIGAIMIFFYFILWRPEQKRRKAMEKLRTSLKKGDKVTAMGILGTIVRVQENTVILKLYDNAKVEILKAAITDVQPGSEEDAKKMDKEDI